jgi:hypothetical protein
MGRLAAAFARTGMIPSLAFSTTQFQLAEFVDGDGFDLIVLDLQLAGAVNAPMAPPPHSCVRWWSAPMRHWSP